MAVPKLRFKEFDGDWSNKKIGNIASKVGSGSTPRGGAEAYTDHGIIFIRSQNVNNDQLLLDDVAYIPEETHVKMSGSKVIANDILLNITGASIGRSCVVPHDFTEANVNQHVCIIRTPNDDPIFVQSFLSSENGQNAIQSKQAGGGREGLNFQAIRSIDFHFPPSKAEQTKIASFLSAVDEKISQLTQKHALLSQYKQGMMQKLFSQQISFKADDGSEFGEWEETTIGKITSTISTGATPSTLKEEYWNGNIKWMSSGELNHRHVHDVEKTITELGFKSSSTKILPKHCVLIGLAGQGKTRGTVAINYIELSTNQSIAAIHPNPKVFDYRFIFFNLDMRYQELRALSTGDGGRGGLNLQIIKGVEIHLPCLEEQTKIANFLSAIDNQIQAVENQITKTETYKKGLLQQMFV